MSVVAARFASYAGITILLGCAVAAMLAVAAYTKDLKKQRVRVRTFWFGAAAYVAYLLGLVFAR